MQTLKDRLVGLLSSPTITEFELVNDYPADNAVLFKHVPTDVQFYLCTDDLDNLLLPLVVVIWFQGSGIVFEYIVPANSYMPNYNNISIKSKRSQAMLIKTGVNDLVELTSIAKAIDSINIEAKGEDDYMSFVKQVQKYKEANFQELRQLPFIYL